MPQTITIKKILPKNKWHSLNDVQVNIHEYNHRVEAKQYLLGINILKEISLDYLYLWGNYNELQKLHSLIRNKLNNSTDIVFNNGLLGLVHHILGDDDKAISCYNKSVKISSKNNLSKDKSQWLGHLGIAYRSQGKLNKSIECHTEALKIAKQISYDRNVGIQLGRLGITYRDVGYYYKSMAFYKESLTLAKIKCSLKNEGLQLGNLGVIYCDLGNYKKALKYINKAILIADQINDIRKQKSLVRAQRKYFLHSYEK